MHWSDLASFLKTTAEQLHIPAGFCTVTQAHRTLFSCECGVDADALAKSRGASFWIYSATKPICETLRAHGALAALMTGSGAAVFGVFPTEEAARGAAEALKAQWPQVYVARPDRGGARVISPKWML